MIPDWNKQRRRTRDLLLEYDQSIMPPRPRAGGLPMVYPWGNDFDENSTALPPFPNSSIIASIYPWELQNLTIMGDWLYQFSKNTGYSGTREEFYSYFGLYLEHNRQEIVFDSFSNFPSTGDLDKLYFDLDEKILYYWDNDYIPANTLLITNTILNGGEA